jgi:hypothetical protein
VKRDGHPAGSLSQFTTHLQEGSHPDEPTFSAGGGKMIDEIGV